MTERRQGYSALHYFHCQSCGYNGPITEAEIAKHRSQCATGTTEPIATGVQLIAAERQRQIEDEEWTPEHDDEHINAELASAALCYTAHASHQVSYPDAAPLSTEMYLGPTGRLWPWSPEWFKPSPDPVRNLVKAGALIAAEIDRIQRRQL